MTRVLDRPELRASATSRRYRLARPVRGRLGVAVGLQAVATVVEVVPLVAVAALGRALMGSTVDHTAAWTAVVVAAAAVLVRLLLAAAATTVSHAAETELASGIRRALIDRLGRVPLGWFARGSGRVKQAVTDDVEALHHLVAHSALEITAAIVAPVVGIVYLASVDWRLTLVAVAPLVVGVVLFRRAGSRFQRGFGALTPHVGRISAAAVEFVHGVEVVKTFRQGRRAYHRFTAAADSYADAFAGFSRGLIAPRARAELVLSPAISLLVTLAGATWLVSAGWLAPRDVLPFVVLAPSLSAPVLALSFAEQSVRAGLAARERIGQVLATPVLTYPVSSQRPRDAGVTLTGVSFGYDADRPVLHDIDLHLAPATMTALVGPSGAGKSSLAGLVARIHDATAGTVRIGGVDVRDMAPEVLAAQVGAVFQDPLLLRDTIRDNIRLSRPHATEDEAERAARAAQIHDRIRRLPRGYDSVVGVDAQLSGGEAQRLAIARALLTDAPILVLDEAVSSADPESEVAVQAALAQLCRDRTVLVIAHRLASITAADQVVVLECGRIVDRGRHEELLTRAGTYSRMWAAQHQEM